ncbi:pyridoxamine 5'-phosphate oxidase family protein [Hydrogenophaga laconesensis]|uniref:General stress protein 26 n=1 Tax=Hydrogenophaga laconesensis TaxID=1805971 RepID=A0ABU1VEV5_9BURK|nr:pyridoxamine 5'-phosphate oxidase family protein [Hydrogenophaga laconesensis]MDR7095992.1 general stress protein 26 [Hydrogenophaga laconesensis]
MSDKDASLESLRDMIKDIRFAMFTTRSHRAHHAGHLHSRPMTTQKVGVDEGTLWFFMSRKGDPVADIAADPVVNVNYADPDKDTYVSVSGTARVVNDPAKVRALWNKAVEAWFPKGPDDPDVALVAVDIGHAHYWDIKENKLVQLLAMTKAVIVGGVPRLGESVEVPVR